MTDSETNRLLMELSQQIGAMRAELEYVRKELSHVAAGLAFVVSESRDNKKKLRGWPTMSKKLTSASESWKQPGH